MILPIFRKERFVQTAKEAGMTVYGHTLCWHSQQNKTYLEKLIAPTVIPGGGGDGGRCLVLKNASALANNYGAQTWYQLRCSTSRWTEIYTEVYGES